MDGQVLGGGVIVLVAVVLWMAYLLPSWQSRHQYTSAERNAVRLNQALRILAETSETPGEVRLELNARTALRQQKLARRAQAERENAELEAARAELAVAREESATERAAVRAERSAAIARARAERSAAHFHPDARRARARRRFRFTATVAGVAGLAAVGVGTWQVVLGASAVLVSAGAVVTALSLFALHRMSRVAARAAVRVEQPAAVIRRASTLADLAVAEPERVAWTPRELPRPLTASVGSRAAAVLDGREAHEALQAAARDEALRERAAELAPPSIDTARVARTAGGSAYSAMGFVDDAEIEDHVRRLLERRAVGA